MTGTIVGFDMPAILEIGDSIGLDREIAVELLPVIEAGMLTGLAERQKAEV